MTPIKFKGSNTVFNKPTDMTDEECSPLHVFVSDDVVSSIWNPTDEERIMIANGSAVILSVYTNKLTLSPMALSVTKLKASDIIVE